VPAATGAEVLSESIGANTPREAGIDLTGSGRRMLEATCGVKAVSVGPLATDGHMLEKESADWTVSPVADTGHDRSGNHHPDLFGQVRTGARSCSRRLDLFGQARAGAKSGSYRRGAIARGTCACKNTRQKTVSNGERHDIKL
jgi:hypothetical protein